MVVKKWVFQAFNISLLFLLTACNLPQEVVPFASDSQDQPTITLAPGTILLSDSGVLDQPTTTTIPQPSATPPLGADTITYRVQYKITTSSDWTSLRLLSGGNWYPVSILSSSQDAVEAGFENNAYALSQSVNRANNGSAVEMVAEAFLAHLDPGEPLIFEIERGHIGETQVEILRIENENPSSVAALTWAGNKTSGHNSQRYEVSPQPFIDSNPNEYIVIAQLNLWYYGSGPAGGFENPDGSRSTPFTPLLGETYHAANPDVVYQQIEWAVEYGVDAFSIEWDSPGDQSLGIPMEKTMDEVFLVSPNIHKIRWAIFYDFILRMHFFEDQGVDMSKPLNFDQPIVYNTFVDDFVHFATKYFNHPQYLTIDGRPVVYVWATFSYIGDLAGAVQEARQQVSDLGYDVFIVGDEVCYGCFNPSHTVSFDSSTSFTFLIPGVDQYALKNVGQAAQTTDKAYTWWRNQISGLKVTGRDDFVTFQPGWTPQYDESWIKDRPEPFYVPAESKEQVLQIAEVARKHAEPSGAENLQFIWANTWNCWGESTTIEPTIKQGPSYPVGNYHFDFLEIVREVFGVETYYTSP